jgi:hypothetical protein
VARLLSLALPLTLALCLAPAGFEALSTSDEHQGSQQEWISRKSQSKGSPKNKQRNKNKHHHHHTSTAQPAISLIS